MKSSNIKLLKIIIVIYLLLISFSLYSKEIPFTQEDRDRIIRIETKLEQMKKRFENRFEDINNRFEDINKRLEDLITYMWMLTYIFTG